MRFDCEPTSEVMVEELAYLKSTKPNLGLVLLYKKSS